MATEDRGRALAGIRREPPPFRVVAVRRVAHLTPHMLRVTFAGDELAGLEIDEPAASVRLLVPSPGADLVIPTWNGNEFLLEGRARPVIRTFTPLHLDPEAQEIDLDIVRHVGGAVSSWADAAVAGDRAAISGPGRGYTIADDAPAFLLAGDETALPAIGQLVEAIPESASVRVIVEVTASEAELPLPSHPALTVEWVVRSAGGAPGDALLPALVAASVEPGAKVWVAGEAAAMHRIRRHLFDDRGLSRRDATVRGYWKHGR